MNADQVLKAIWLAFLQSQYGSHVPSGLPDWLYREFEAVVNQFTSEYGYPHERETWNCEIDLPHFDREDSRQANR